MHCPGPDVTSPARTRRRRPWPPLGAPAVAVTLLLLTFGATTRNVWLLACYFAAVVVVLARGGLPDRLAPRQRLMVLVVVLIATLTLPFNVARNPTALLHYCVALASLGVALSLTRDLRAYVIGSRACLIGCQMALVAYLLHVGVWDFPLEQLFEHTSSNGITSRLVLIQANYSVAQFLVRRRISLLTPLITLGICIIGYGRASILVAAAICALCLLWRGMPRPGQSAIVPLLLLVCISASAYLWGSTAVEALEQSTKLGAGLYDEPRERMIEEYRQKIDAATLVTGASYEGTSIESEFYGNPHNSFIRGHHLFGLPYLLAMLCFPLFMLAGRRDASGTVFTVAVLAMVLARSVTEPLLFPTMFDAFFFALCVVGARTARRRMRPRPRVDSALGFDDAPRREPRATG